MGLDRTAAERFLRDWRRVSDQRQFSRLADFFAEDGIFTNSTLPEPVRGPEAIRSLASTWPADTVNEMEWSAIDGNRVIFGFNERQESWKPDAPLFRGVCILVLNDDGLVTHYEAIFDTAVLARAMEHLEGVPVQP